MAENADGQEKTEDATSKRLTDAREKGQVGKSTDTTTAALLLLGGMTVFLFGEQMVNDARLLLIEMFKQAHKLEFNDTNTVAYFYEIIIYLTLLMLPVLGSMFLIGFGAEVAQVGFKFATKKFTEGLNFAKIFNPLPGLRKLVISQQTVVELTKSLLKLLILGGVVYSVLSEQYDDVVELMARPFGDIAVYMRDIAFEVLYKVGIAYLFIAAADYFYSRYRFAEDMKMTKQEVKEEGKQMEGDMQMKMRMRSIGRERIRKLMLSRVKNADVVITNPTHYAIALEYKPESMDTPRVIAKGVDHLAHKIKQIALENRVPIVEDKPLARALYASVEVDQDIPETLFKAVAQILADIFRKRKKIPVR